MMDMVLFILLVVTSLLSGLFVLVVMEILLEWMRQRKHLKSMPHLQETILHKKPKKDILFSKLSRHLHQAGITLPLWLLMLIFAATASFVSMLLYLFLPHWSMFFLGAFITALFFHQLLAFLRYRRTKKFNQALSIALALLVRMMRNGIGFDQALAKVVDMSVYPLFKNTMRRFIVQKQQMGEERAFEYLVDSIDSRELKIFILSVRIGEQSGGAFSATLEKLESALKSQEKLQRFIDSKTQETKVGSYLILFLIIFIFIVLDINFNGNVSKYFFFTLKGKVATLVIAGWLALGLYINTFITKIKR